MGRKANVFTADLASLIEQLVTLHHYQFFISGQLKDGTERVQKSLQVFLEKGWKKEDYAMGSCMTIFDVFHKKGGEWLLIAPTRGRLTAGDDVVRIAEETERRFNSWLAVALYERFESFLKATFGKMLYQLRNETTIRDKRRFHRANIGISKREGTLPYFMQYSQYACRRDCSLVLKYYRDNLDVKRFVVDKYWQMTFEELMTVLGHARHAIVHTQGQLTDKVLKSLIDAQKSFLERWMHESVYEAGGRLLPDRKLLEQCYETVGSYSRGIYVLLSERFNMADESGYFR